MNNDITTQVAVAVAATIIAAIIIYMYRKLFNSYSERNGILLYDLRRYKIEEETIEILYLWNPTSHAIEKKDITSEFCLDSNVTSFHSIAKTHHNLDQILSVSEKKIRLNLENFPAQSGCVYLIKSPNYGISDKLLESGEINCQKTQNYGIFCFHLDCVIAQNIVKLLLCFPPIIFAVPLIEKLDNIFLIAILIPILLITPIIFLITSLFKITKSIFLKIKYNKNRSLESFKKLQEAFDGKSTTPWLKFWI